VDGGPGGGQGLSDVVECDRWCRHCAYRTTGIKNGPCRSEFKLIPRGAASIVISMNEPVARSAVDVELRRIERRLEELVATVNQLKEENRALRQRQDTLINERANLLQKNEQVRARVEAMIGRLKSMEQG
jgi:cell division protein ZapB